MIRFIKSRNPNRTVHFSWFGGEPLIGKKNHRQDLRSVRRGGHSFNSRMITNGGLVSNEIIRKMQEEWNLKVLQITLDGTESSIISEKTITMTTDQRIGMYFRVSKC